MMNHNSEPLVSIIMNSYNGEKFVQEAIESIYAQNYKNWEIIFWDNASVDNTAKIAQAFDSKTKYFCSKKNIPLGYARNLAFNKANGDFIAFLDDDDLWLPTKLEEQIPIFLKNSDIGLVYSDVIYFNQKGHEKRNFDQFNYLEGRCFSNLLAKIEAFPITTASVIFRSKVLKSNLIDCADDLVPIRDADLFCRIAYDWEIQCVNSPLAKIRIHDKQDSINHQDWFYKEWERNLDVYDKLIPDFKTKYYNERITLLRYIAFTKAKYFWSTNNIKDAKKLIRPYILKNRKAFILFILFIFPEKITRKIFHFLRRDVRA